MNLAFLITAYLAILGVGIAASITDLRTHRIPNKLTGPAMLAALGFWLIAGLIAGKGLMGGGAGTHGTLAGAMIGLVCGLVPYGVLVSMGGLGGGDMKLMAAIGAWGASWQIVLATTFYALLIGALMAVVLMIKHKRVMLTLTRLVGIAVTRGKALKPDDDATAPKVPFAIALACGAAVAGAEHMLGLWKPLLW